MFYTKYHTVVSSCIVIYSEQLSVTALATTYMEINGTIPPKTKVFRVWKHMENLGWVASCHVFLGLGLGVWSSPSSGSPLSRHFWMRLRAFGLDPGEDLGIWQWTDIPSIDGILKLAINCIYCMHHLKKRRISTPKKQQRSKRSEHQGNENHLRASRLTSCLLDSFVFAVSFSWSRTVQVHEQGWSWYHQKFWIVPLIGAVFSY